MLALQRDGRGECQPTQAPERKRDCPRIAAISVFQNAHTRIHVKERCFDRVTSIRLNSTCLARAIIRCRPHGNGRGKSGPLPSTGRVGLEMRLSQAIILLYARGAAERSATPTWPP